ncbi:MAG: aspartate carbamoyltransferase regulatory subunit [Paludibacter sp.]|jgi:aspartate carbamoyltransferase regulatory subunit|nr:aspartate carbamoyltransferase regulatory subunit [Paludibacter sp.]
MEKELKVAALRNGTVIDHIPAEKLFQVVSILQLKYSNIPITIGNNLESKHIGTKGIIKIADRILSDDETGKIALVAPNATINIIKEYQVVEKRPLVPGDEVHDLVHCANPVCITNHQPVPTNFYVLKEEGRVKLKCRYCEREFLREEIKLKKK